LVLKIKDYQITNKLELFVKLVTIILIFLWDFYFLSAQDPLRFKDEADSLGRLHIVKDADKKIIVFTGSSSIRRWSDIQEYFPGKIVINTGFGGSHMSDLLFYVEQVVINYMPDQIFIYEGDNDIAYGTKPGKILRDTKKVVERIQESLPASQIILISAKPSLARWQFKEEYEDVNSRYREYASKQDYIDFVDVWVIMLDDRGEPKREIFIEDSLHLNKAGYDIWAEEIGKFIR